MAHRLSRGEKGKWIQDQPKQAKRPPVIILASNNYALIEEHKLTLIGRVTNPAIQKTKALVDFFLNHWNVAGQITGKALGPYLFQFKFETERDLQLILSKGPYHFKRWMLILQRWEPIVSDNFPSLIPFWISVHSIPLHYWTEDALKAIGKVLGPVEDWDVDRGRVRVSINGLKPLEMKHDISLPSGEIKEVELEYENLEKHCFHCLSLTHEGDACPTFPRKENRDGRETRLGISQNRTLERLEADRRRKDEKKGSRNLNWNPSENFASSTRWKNEEHKDSSWRSESNPPYDYGIRRDPHRRYESSQTNRDRPGRPSARERLSFTKESEAATHRENHSKSYTSALRTE